jgi:hypothetical protein
MSTLEAHSLEEAIRQAGEGWLIDSAPPGEAVNHLRQALAVVERVARERLGADAPDFSDAAIVAELQRRPAQVRGFFQALGGNRTPEMLLMVWRIIQGMQIKRVELDYERWQSFAISVILESADGVEDAPYHSTNINDFSLFRHIGILVASGRPVFEGFYPLRVKAT